MKQTTTNQATAQPQTAHSKEYYEGYMECSRKIEEALVERQELLSQLTSTEESYNILGLARTSNSFRLLEQRHRLRSKAAAYRQAASICHDEWKKAIREITNNNNNNKEL